MPQFTLDDFAVDGNVHLNKSVCTGGKCRAGPNIHLQNTATESHDAILHGLNRRVGKLYFGVEPFQPTIEAWKGRPIVFGRMHPDPRLFRKDPQAELDRISGTIVGELADSQISITGHPKLMVKKNYTDETARSWYEQGLISEDQLERSIAAVPVALKLNEEGKLSHSSGFICPDDGDQLTGVVIPDHVLDFEETPLDQPVDRMSVILNKEEEDNVTEDPVIIGNTHLNEGKVMSKKNRERLKGILDGISTFFNEMVGAMDETTSAKTQMEVIAAGSTPAKGSLESRIDMVRAALTATLNLKYPDGTPRGVWTIMTLPERVIWQHPDTLKYFASGYTSDGDEVKIAEPVEVEQAYIVKEAQGVFTNMTAEDIENIITKRNKMESDRTDRDAEIAKLQKEKDDTVAAKDAEIARLQKEYDELKAADELAKKNKEDADWASLKKDIIPPGLVKDPADEDALRKLCKENPVEFNSRILAERVKAPARNEEGASHTSGPNSGTDYLTVTRELRMASGRMR